MSGSSTQPITLERARLHLEGLPLRRRRHDHPRRLDRAAGRELQDLIGVIGQGVGRDDLHRMKRRSVGDVHERDARLRVAPGAHPAPGRDRRVLRRLAGQDFAPAELSLVHRSYRMDHPVKYGVPGRNFEPATHSLGNCCSIRLSYGDRIHRKSTGSQPGWQESPAAHSEPTSRHLFAEFAQSTLKAGNAEGRHFASNGALDR